MALKDDLEQIAGTLPANDVPDYHDLAAVLGALIETCEEAGIGVSEAALEASRDAQMQALIATGPRVAYGPAEAAKLSQVDELISKLQGMLGEQGSSKPAGGEDKPTGGGRKAGS